jgi:hypothetical protein
MGVSGQHHAPPALYPRGKDPPVPRAGLDTEVRGKIISPLPGIEPGSPGRPARSQTLYWLSYPAHHYMHYITLRWKLWNNEPDSKFSDTKQVGVAAISKSVIENKLVSISAQFLIFLMKDLSFLLWPQENTV